MAARSEIETKRIQYLLGLCSPADREHIESEYFEDKDAFQKMLSAEDDLIDAYARGELSSEERRNFEEHFLKSSNGRKRVEFARALAGSVSDGRSVETRPDIVVISWRNAVRIAAVAAVLIVAVILSWLLVDRGRMRSELTTLRAENAELKQNANAERVPAAEIAEQPNDRREQPVKPTERDSSTTEIQRVRRLPNAKVKNGPENSASIPTQLKDKPLKDIQDGALGNNFVAKRITQIPLEARNVTSLLSLQPGTTADGYVAGQRADQTNMTLDGVDINQRENWLSLTPGTPISPPGHVLRGTGPITIELTNSPGWIRLRLLLEKPAKHTDYRLTIDTADNRQIASVDWIEPLTLNQNSIDTPVIRTGNLSSGDYQLTLAGKEPNGSFVRVAQYSFKITRK